MYQEEGYDILSREISSSLIIDTLSLSVITGGSKRRFVKTKINVDISGYYIVQYGSGIQYKVIL